MTFTRGRPSLKNNQCNALAEKWRDCAKGWSAMTASLANTQARQLAELYRALRLYVNCFQPSMKLQSKQRDGKKVRCVYDSAKTPREPVVPLRRPACPEAARANRGGTHARPHPRVSTTRAVATGRLPLCHELLSLRFTHPICPHPRFFRGIVYGGNVSCREERPRPGSRVPHLVPRAGAEKTRAGLATYLQRPL